MFTIDSKLDAVSLIRHFVDLGLHDCAVIVDAWAMAYGMSGTSHWECNDINHIRKLGSMCKMVVNGTWKIVGEKIMVNREISNDDIYKLS